MLTYLFLWTITAGTSTAYGHANYQTQHWKAQWVNSGEFNAPEHCRKAAVSLGVSKENYRCISKDGSLK